MSENPIAITSLNDFVFCPVSIYFHSLDIDEELILLQSPDQLDGTNAHEKSDLAAYSTKKNMLQGISVYCEKYNLYGKIDIFDSENGILTERKKKIKNIYDGYIFQLYGQYFSLLEMGYKVKELRFYSMDDNKLYKTAKPEDNPEMLEKFIKILNDINSFSFENFKQTNSSKCERCIYESLCSFSSLKGVV